MHLAHQAAFGDSARQVARHVHRAPLCERGCRRAGPPLSDSSRTAAARPPCGYAAHAPCTSGGQVGERGRSLMLQARSFQLSAQSSAMLVRLLSKAASCRLAWRMRKPAPGQLLTCRLCGRAKICRLPRPCLGPNPAKMAKLPRGPTSGLPATVPPAGVRRRGPPLHRPPAAAGFLHPEVLHTRPSRVHQKKARACKSRSILVYRPRMLVWSTVFARPEVWPKTHNSVREVCGAAPSASHTVLPRPQCMGNC